MSDAKAARRDQARYYATTHTQQRTMLSDGALTELCATYLELLADFRALEAAHETQDQALDEALRQRDVLRTMTSRRGAEGEG